MDPFWVEIIGFTAAFLTTVSFLPQAIKTIKTQDTSALSLTMYSVFCFGVSLWLIYGLLLKNWPMTLANAVTLLLAGTIWLLKLIHTLRGESNEATKEKGKT